MRNRYRRYALAPEIRQEITPKNILMIGPTGVGKTEIARRLARIADAPFIKVEATKFTQVGYVGRDCESIVRDLMDVAVSMVHEERVAQVREEAARLAEDRIIEILASHLSDEPAPIRKKGLEAATGPIALAPVARAGEGSPAASSQAGSAPARRRRQTSRAQARKLVAERMARHELEEQIIEIELEPEEGYSSILEFVSGISPDDLGDGFQELMSAVPSNRRRARRVSVKEARRLLTQEEANKLIDLDQVAEQATQRVEQGGIVFLDELDKIVGSKVDVGPDVAGEGVQRDLLPLVEGSTVMTRFGPVKTDHILWVAAGAFQSHKPSDLIPELQGRLPLRVELAALTQADFKRILTQPENALTRQYEALLGIEGVRIEFTDDGLEEIARAAYQMNQRTENIGARRLHTIMEQVLEEVSFNAPDLADQTFVIDAAFVRGRLEKLLQDEDLSKYIL
jgi:ATP-dependent HslUV protease ATP-binding subunit HslU